jgi:cytochrome b561
MNKVVGIGIGLTVLFLLLASVIMPNYNIAGNINTATNYTPEGPTGGIMSQLTYTGLLLLVFVLAIVGIALTFLRKK